MFNYLGNWGGIAGAVTLEAVPRTHVKNVLVLPDVERRRATFRVAVAGEGAGIIVRVSTPSGASAQANVAGEEASVELPLPDAPLWTPG